MGVVDDASRMRAALAEAEKAAFAGEIPVGAICVIGNNVVSAGCNRTIAESDPSAHAEIVALREAGRAVGNHRLPGATLFVTLEPCAMCIGAIAQARIDRLVFGAYDSKAGAAGSAIDLKESRALNHRFEVLGGVLEDECADLLRRFFEARRGA